MIDEYLTPAEVQKIGRFSRQTFYRLVARKQLTVIKLGRSSLVKASELKQLLDGCPKLNSVCGLKASLPESAAAA